LVKRAQKVPQFLLAQLSIASRLGNSTISTDIHTAYHVAAAGSHFAQNGNGEIHAKKR
jgi:hypothetical protein